MQGLLRWLYAGWFALIMAAILVQFFLAGLGVFAFNGIPPYFPHLLVGDLIGIAILLGCGLARRPRSPGRRPRSISAFSC